MRLARGGRRDGVHTFVIDVRPLGRAGEVLGVGQLVTFCKIGRAGRAHRHPFVPVMDAAAGLARSHSAPLDSYTTSVSSAYPPPLTAARNASRGERLTTERHTTNGSPLARPAALAALSDHSTAIVPPSTSTA